MRRVRWCMMRSRGSSTCPPVWSRQFGRNREFPEDPERCHPVSKTQSSRNLNNQETVKSREPCSGGRYQVSPFHVSRFTFHVSRITHHASLLSRHPSPVTRQSQQGDRKSTRLNSSHVSES